MGFLRFARPSCHTERSRGMSTPKWVRFAEFHSCRAPSPEQMGSFCVFLYSDNRIGGDYEWRATFSRFARRNKLELIRELAGAGEFPVGACFLIRDILGSWGWSFY